MIISSNNIRIRNFFFPISDCGKIKTIAFTFRLIPILYMTSLTFCTFEVFLVPGHLGSNMIAKTSNKRRRCVKSVEEKTFDNNNNKKSRTDIKMKPKKIENTKTKTGDELVMMPYVERSTRIWHSSLSTHPPCIYKDCLSLQKGYSRKKAL